jgi:dTDP-4-dehydrorhamnose 3,5-epimerase-like enzyme
MKTRFRFHRVNFYRSTRASAGVVQTFPRQVWMPQGFAHGYLMLSDEAELPYKVTN